VSTAVSTTTTLSSIGLLLSSSVQLPEDVRSKLDGPVLLLATVSSATVPAGTLVMFGVF
jgi:hypothetical protein